MVIDQSHELMDGEPGHETGPADVLLADYVAFSGMAGPDPRTVTVGEVADGLCQIIDTEGPMIAKRAFDIYLRGCGIRRLGGELKSTMNKALSSAVGQGRVICENVTSRTGLILSTVRSKGAAPVRPRRRGPRSFEEIPPSELQAIAQRLSDALNLVPGSDELLSAIVEILDLPLMSAQVRSALRETFGNQADEAQAAGFGGKPPGSRAQRRA